MFFNVVNLNLCMFAPSGSSLRISRILVGVVNKQFTLYFSIKRQNLEQKQGILIENTLNLQIQKTIITESYLVIQLPFLHRESLLLLQETLHTP